MSWIRRPLNRLVVVGAVVISTAAIFAVKPIGGGGFPTPTPTATATSTTVPCTTTISSGSVSSALSSLASGGTLCLNAGSSYTYTASTITKASPTTVRAADGVSRDSVVLPQVATFSSNNLVFDTLTIKGGLIGEDAGQPTTNTTFRHIHWTACVIVRQPTSVTMNLTFDGDLADLTAAGGTVNNASPCLDDGRFYLRGYSTSGTTDKAWTIKNIDFPGSRCTDGIEVVGNANGFTIGPGNEFHGILQDSATPNCSGGTHVDPVQFFGAHHGVVTGNYFHGNTDGIMSPDGVGDNMTISNNVFGTNGDSYPYSIIDCGGNNQTYSHNDFLDDAIQACQATSGQGGDGPTTGMSYTNNYAPGGFVWVGQTACTGITADYNMRPSSVSALCGGTHNVVGTASFTGGATPSTWAGFALAGGSPGKGVASDGTDIGINP